MHRRWKTSGDKNGGGGFYRTGTGLLFSEFFRLIEYQVNTPSKLVEESETKVHLYIIGKVSIPFTSILDTSSVHGIKKTGKCAEILMYLTLPHLYTGHMPTIWSCHFVEGQVLFFFRGRNFIKMCFASSEPVFDQHFEVNRSKNYWLLILFTHLIEAFLLSKMEPVHIDWPALLKSKSVFVGEFHLYIPYKSVLLEKKSEQKFRIHEMPSHFLLNSLRKIECNLITCIS